jgi:hypothetical protein
MSRAASPSDLVEAVRAAGIGDERVLAAISATPVPDSSPAITSRLPTATSPS